MNNWLKYIISIGTGFLAGAGTATQTTPGNSTAILAQGGVGALLALLNLRTEKPVNKEVAVARKEATIVTEARQAAEKERGK